MDAGKIPIPNLDDRTWQDLVDQTTQLIPRFAPGWTDRNPSDLGITLIELFAWLVESMLYRLNKVPDRTYIEFLNLLGILRDPPVPATTMLTFQLTSPMTVETADGSNAFHFATQADYSTQPRMAMRPPAPGYPAPGYVAPAPYPPAPYYPYPYYSPYYYGPGVGVYVGPGYGYRVFRR